LSRGQGLNLNDFYLFLKKANQMQRVVLEKVMTEEEYIAFELASEVRHEFIDGKVIEMPGESKLNNDIAGNIYIFLKAMVKAKGWQIFSHDVKLKVSGQNVFYYPDLFITDDAGAESDYYSKSALLVVEILSPTTRHFDMFDKYLEYRKIPELRYYLLVEPSKKLITLCQKDDKGDWSTELFDEKDGTIDLKFLGLSLNVAAVFE
jgi:Uma2 family endonuclease